MDLICRPAEDHAAVEGERFLGIGFVIFFRGWELEDALVFFVEERLDHLICLIRIILHKILSPPKYQMLAFIGLLALILALPVAVLR